MQPTNVVPITRVRRRHPRLAETATIVIGSISCVEVQPALCHCTSCGQTGWLLVLDRAAPPCPGCGGAVTVAS